MRTWSHAQKPGLAPFSFALLLSLLLSPSALAIAPVAGRGAALLDESKLRPVSSPSGRHGTAAGAPARKPCGAGGAGAGPRPREPAADLRHHGRPGTAPRAVPAGRALPQRLGRRAGRRRHRPHWRAGRGEVCAARRPGAAAAWLLPPAAAVVPTPPSCRCMRSRGMLWTAHPALQPPTVGRPAAAATQRRAVANPFGAMPWQRG